MAQIWRNPFIRTLCGAAAIALILPAGTAAQEIPVTEEARYEEGFGYLSSVRELSDGRVLVADPLGMILASIDLDTGEMEALSRQGGGPGEYRQPDAVYALPGDSTLLVDLGNGRLTIMAPDGSFARNRSLLVNENIEPGRGGLQLLIPRTVDAEGNLYFGIRNFQSPDDSSSVARFDLRGEEVTEVAKVKPREVQRSGSGGNISIQQLPMTPEDDWTAGPDGSVVLVRSDGYYVEIVRPDGTVSRGDPVRVDPIRPSDAEKIEYLENSSSSGISVEIGIEDGVRSTSFSRGGPGGRNRELNEYSWPDRMPVFRNASTRVSPDGRIWVGRTVRAGEPARFDIFSAEGALSGYVMFGPRASIVGFGAEGVVYVSEVDDFGLHWLKKMRVG